MPTLGDMVYSGVIGAQKIDPVDNATFEKNHTDFRSFVETHDRNPSGSADDPDEKRLHTWLIGCRVKSKKFRNSNGEKISGWNADRDRMFNELPSIGEGVRRASCDRCRARKIRCDSKRPCSYCKQNYMKKHKLTSVDGVDPARFECFYSPAERRGPRGPHKRFKDKSAITATNCAGAAGVGGGIVGGDNAMKSQMAAKSGVSFPDDLDGSTIRIGVLRTRWNDEHVSSLVDGIKAGVKECKVTDENIFIKEVPGAYELPYAAKLLAMSGTVDAIVCTGVLIKGDTYHFEYISDAVTKGIMDVNLSTMTPVVYGVLNCLDEAQVKKRASNDDGGHNHGEDWGKTAVEMAIMRREAMAKGGGGKVKELAAMGFQSAAEGSDSGKVKEKPRFF